ncbi:MAG: imelysin family protein [Ferruginibacter sp.]
MKKLFLPALLAATLFTACKKDDNNNNVTPDFNATKDAAISDFVNKVALPGYAELKAKANYLNTAITTLNTATNENNLGAAKNAWKDLRVTWERCEGFLFGPIEDDNYDPQTDTWPVNFNDMDALLANASQGLSVADVATFTDALKGYHPIEYILWGEGGTRTAASLTAREKEYMVSLSALLNTAAENLYSSWDLAGGNYATKFLTAGQSGNTTFTTKQAALLALVQGMVDICGEVGDGKMKEPYDAYPLDPVYAAQIVESPFSGNSVTDFRNNITGAFNVYLGKFNADGTGLEDLVKARNTALDIDLQQKFNSAIESFNVITVKYEEAIGSQRTQCANAMAAINALAVKLDTELRAFVIANITD